MRSPRMWRCTSPSPTQSPSGPKTSQPIWSSASGALPRSRWPRRESPKIFAARSWRGKSRNSSPGAACSSSRLCATRARLSASIYRAPPAPSWSASRGLRSARPEMALAYTRALLKISGEALAGDKGFGLDYHMVEAFAEEIKAVHALGVHLSLVVGGGNIIRGPAASREGLDRVSADYMGMLGTVINALALQDVLEKIGVDTRVMTAIRMESVAEPYIRRRAVRHLEKGRLIIFAAGTGNPFFSTDTAGVLRALEIEAQVILKATNVDGIYTGDPRTDPTATFIPELTFQEAIVKNYAVMHANAFGLCKANQLPIVVFNINQPGAITRVLQGDRVGTIVR